MEASQISTASINHVAKKTMDFTFPTVDNYPISNVWPAVTPWETERGALGGMKGAQNR